METKWKKIKPFFIVSVIGLVIGAGIFCLVFFLKSKTLVDACNAASLAGVILIFLGLIALVNHLGAFDTIAFGFRQMGASMFAKDPRSAGTFAEYKEHKNELRASRKPTFLALICVGILFILIYVVLQIILSGRMPK